MVTEMEYSALFHRPNVQLIVSVICIVCYKEAWWTTVLKSHQYNSSIYNKQG